MVSSCLTDAHEHYYRPTLDNGGYTICRLKKVEKVHESFRGRQQRQYWCLYEGANGSGELKLWKVLMLALVRLFVFTTQKKNELQLKI